MFTDICRKILELKTSKNAKVLKEFDETVVQWELYSQQHPELNFSLLLTAITFAAGAHEGLTRKGKEATPYIIHPIGVARILWEEGKVRDPIVLIGAILHDVLEDTKYTEDSISRHFGDKVLKVVIELTDDPNLKSKEEKKRMQIEKAPHLSQRAKLIKLADRLYNIRDLKTSPPAKWNEEDVQNYVQWGRKLLEALKGTNSDLESALEKELTQR